ncbi:MAG: hypothetical protein K2X93_10045 [Candidatus Obscuribacterales bacterium]|nr:hypothetical protein [Candidatus Obscuribacterales bacterium]
MKPESLSDPDMQKATAALIRASKRARELAQQTGRRLEFITQLSIDYYALIPK